MKMTFLCFRNSSGDNGHSELKMTGDQGQEHKGFWVGKY